MRVGEAGIVLQHEELELEELAEEAHLGRLARLLLGTSKVDGLACGSGDERVRRDTRAVDY